ncbi:mismatch repair endonuclease PMS2 isoform X2 [Zootermopsis nevadensis]|uniref:mismatch repair endonuclease PMS2 isoform X2 n=1 Tax=Zootermopsis nevadensis TaxID=136037 RepID=UPI000B8E404F|nr:mismatch repair endonuclease PMS2 isoform X2 [Zootermopsis nevadensis]
MELPSVEEKSTRIEAINKDVVHQICSGQVVLNLATAVKELVENSLDAGATVIEVRLKDYGSELVEVIDNGTGVEEENFQALTLKHHTSKLREFTDLVLVETFGFRGEALSSLCALSEMTVVTRHSSASCGTRLEFDHTGKIIRKKSCARQVGTTVSLLNLFSSLPVRQKEFHRSLHREFAKMTQFLYAYCLVCIGTKISCTNQTKKGGRTVVVSTRGSETVCDNIACIYGAKQVQSLMEVLQKRPPETMLQAYGISEALTSTKNPFQLEGYISSCAHGQGRSTTDRQFFYVNSRPCEPTKVIKIVNEVYHQFNQHQYPFVFLNMKTARSTIDVNVTPDKRQIFLDHEKLLITTIKNISSSPVPQTPPSPTVTAAGNLEDMFRQWSHSPAYNHSKSPTSAPVKGRGVKRLLDSTKKEGSAKSKLHCINNFFSPRTEEGIQSISTEVEIPIHNSFGINNTLNTTQDEIELENVRVINDTVEFLNEGIHTEFNKNKGEHASHEVCMDIYKQTTENDNTVITDEEINQESVKESLMTRESSPGDIKDTDVIQNNWTNYTNEEISQPCETEVSNGKVQNIVVKLDDVKMDDLSRKIVHMSVSIDHIKLKIEQHKKHNANKDKRQMSVRFHAEIDPTKNESAEIELRKEISQDMFAKMEILGQFNLGFIVTRLGPDLFIIDQHATDEKYNFEMLQLNTILQNQRLVIPQKLDLTSVNESILIENEEIFNKNGFDFIIDEKAEPTKRVQLTAIPVSKTWEFGKEDIDELIFMLQDSPHTMCRPSRIRSMFASRACRKSVMIGTALSRADMRRLIENMGQIEQPWNCPHGRPTMRHLINLDLIHNG